MSKNLQNPTDQAVRFKIIRKILEASTVHKAPFSTNWSVIVSNFRQSNEIVIKNYREVRGVLQVMIDENKVYRSSCIFTETYSLR